MWGGFPPQKKRYVCSKKGETEFCLGLLKTISPSLFPKFLGSKTSLLIALTISKHRWLSKFEGTRWRSNTEGTLLINVVTSISFFACRSLSRTHRCFGNGVEEEPYRIRGVGCIQLLLRPQNFTLVKVKNIYTQFYHFFARKAKRASTHTANKSPFLRQCEARGSEAHEGVAFRLLFKFRWDLNAMGTASWLCGHFFGKGASGGGGFQP